MYEAHLSDDVGTACGLYLYWKAFLDLPKLVCIQCLFFFSDVQLLPIHCIKHCLIPFRRDRDALLFDEID